ncbi:hypothetical protein N7494_003422 [Penicillium frequentans]|uniref:Zn(2)-C6 fungal-type domain-containing protein n=1 Tax=Penicillium frequentans TaxID=3151616 RepID=A0AAD6CYZ5_9EURO|nr:hypothetical protein N7494_003422 [Penicillium glabrum]
MESQRKRPRPVVSCLRCREKKLKCDRVAPCQNCVKGGYEAECTYHQQPDAVDPHSQPKPKRAKIAEAIEPGTLWMGPSIGIIEDLQQRVLKLESLHAVGPHANNYGPIRDASVQNSWPRPEISQSSSSYLGTLVVKGSRSRYHGQNDRITLLNQFAEAKTFINQSLNNPSLVGLAKEVQFLQNKSQTPNESPESLSGIESFPELQSLLGSLPSKTVCDQLLLVYTQNLEKNLRILHIPSFLACYNAFWATSDHETSFLSMFVPLLTVVLSISVITETAPPSPEYSPSWDYLEQHAVGAVHAWMQKLPRKPRTDISTLQVRSLLLLARQLRQVSLDELWKESGSLVRSAMVMGLHVNLSQSKSLSPFQAECRRRLWVSIVEMDLQTAIAAGMPVMTPALDLSPLTPSNLNDVDFDESTTELPLSRPMDEETDSLAQITLAQSLALRIRTMNLVQHTNPEESIEERLRHGQQIEESLQMIPPPLKLYDSDNSDPAFVLNRVILDVHIRRPLLSLYRPVLASLPPDDPSFLEIQRASLDSSIAILAYQDTFDPNIFDLDIPNINSYWNIFHTFCQNDIILAALTVCEYLKFINQQTSIHSSFNEFSFQNNNNQQNQNNTINPYPTNHTLSHNKASLTRLVENTIDSLTRRIGKKGTNMKDILLLSVVLQSVRARGPTEQKDRRMSHGAKKALSACRQNLLSAANESIFAFHFNDPNPLSNYESPDVVLPPNVSAQLNQPSPSMPDLLQQSASLAAEFDTFQSDLFTFDDGSFMWNI